MKRPFASLGLLGVAALVLPACVDTSPIDYQAPVQPDAGLTDAATSHMKSLTAACKSCVTAGACRPLFDTCTANAQCSAYVGCLLDAYCFNYPPSNLGDLPPCIYACGTAAGITSQTDPAVAPLLELFPCAQAHGADGCGDVCDIDSADE